MTFLHVFQQHLIHLVFSFFRNHIHTNMYTNAGIFFYKMAFIRNVSRFLRCSSLRESAGDRGDVLKDYQAGNTVPREREETYLMRRYCRVLEQEIRMPSYTSNTNI